MSEDIAAMDARRLTYQEAMELVPLPPTEDPGGCSSARRYMARRPAWLPGTDIHDELMRLSGGRNIFPVHTAVFGGHVYAQSVLAVCQLLESDAGAGPATRQAPGSLGLHTIHGYFTAAGRADRPFVYEASVITQGRSFVTARVDARQPLRPSCRAAPGAIAVSPDQAFPLQDAVDQPLGFVCFTALVSFALPRPHSFGADVGEPPVQARFAAVLRQRAPAAWDPAPPADMEVMLAAMERRDIVGTFPMVDMKKVDMAAYNADRPLHERRELILYRLLAPMPGAATGPMGSAAAAAASASAANQHILVHAYAADRNGLLMAANHLEFPLNDKTATLSNSFVVHTNAEDAQMAYRPERETDNDLGGWWIQEFCFPRASAGRAIILNKIWSPSGVHVATEYQDGLCTAKLTAGFDLKL